MSRLSIAERYARGEFPDAWKPDREHSRRLAAKNPTPSFALAAPHAMDEPFTEVFLMSYLVAACREKYGDNWKFQPQHQLDGTCVGQSHKILCDVGMAANRFRHGTTFPGRACVASNYAGGRVEIARQPGRWQGSNGSWSAEFLVDYGILLLDDIGLPHDAMRQDELLALRWTASHLGVPVEYETIAKTKPFEASQQVLTTDEVSAALQADQPVNICTPYIPSRHRNADGISSVSRRSGHSTLIVGQRMVGRRKVFAYLQSWGDWAAGPYGWYNYDKEGAFESSIVDITEEALRAILKSRDCYTFTTPEGLQKMYERYW